MAIEWLTLLPAALKAALKVLRKDQPTYHLQIGDIGDNSQLVIVLDSPDNSPVVYQDQRGEQRPLPAITEESLPPPVAPLL